MTPQKNKITYLILLGLGLFLELAFVTFWKGKAGLYGSPIIWLTGGLLFCFAAMRLAHLPDLKVAKVPSKPLLITLSVWFIGTCLSVFWLKNIFEAFPIDAAQSDIIPSLEYYVRRFLSGETVYKPMPFAGYEVNPTYFPLLWLPYVFSEILQIDYRWTAFILFDIALLFWMIRLSKMENSLPALFLKSAIPFIFIFNYVQHDNAIFSLAVELLPIGFYLLLALSILHRSTLVMGLGILLCLLSRYAFTFWLPLYLLIILLEKGFPKAVQVSMVVLVGIIGIYVLPFLSKDWTIFQKGFAYYETTATAEWEHRFNPGDIPFHLSRGLSFAVYSYQFVEGDTATKLKRSKSIHLLACALAALGLLLYYLRRRKEGLKIGFFLLVALKAYLMVFYGFFYVPFSYLFAMPLFLSIPVLFKLRF